MTTYVIETYTLVDGWINCSHENGEPATYTTQAAAQAEIDDLVSEMGYDPDDYRVIEE